MEKNQRKILVQICSGTACFVMGGSDLLTLFEYLSPVEREQVSLAAVPCFEHCRAYQDKRPPFVMIDGQTHDRMDMEKLLTEIRKIIEQ